MSFDLYFCAPSDTPIDITGIRHHLQKLEHTTESRSDDGSVTQFEYRNPATGVCCLFDLVTEVETRQDRSSTLPNGYVDAGLAVSINFLRPHFFALELMPIVLAMADWAGRSLYDPQEERMYAPGSTSEALIASWNRSNDWATRAAASGDNPGRKPYLSREQALYWWQYTREREAYQKTLGKDVFAPSMLLMIDARKQVKSVVVWSAKAKRTLVGTRLIPLPQVFPECDYLILAWGSDAKNLAKALTPYPIVIAALANLLDGSEGPVDGLRILRPARQSEASKIFDKLPRTRFDSLQPLPADGFMDVLLP